MEKYLKNEYLKEEFLRVNKAKPGFFEFLECLQEGNQIRFEQLKFGKNPRDVIIEVVYREEVGVRQRSPGVGCIEYANVLEDGNFSPLHKDGYFPCQTFMSMRDWYRHSDSYEVIN
jgi:hypothetical protein